MFMLFEFVVFVGLDMVVRDESGSIMDGNETSTTELYEHHIRAIDRIRKATVSAPCSHYLV